MMDIMSSKEMHRLTIRMERQLIARAKIKSAMTGVSISAFVRSALERWTEDVPHQLQLPEPEEDKSE